MDECQALPGGGGELLARGAARAQRVRELVALEGEGVVIEIAVVVSGLIELGLELVVLQEIALGQGPYTEQSTSVLSASLQTPVRTKVTSLSGAQLQPLRSAVATSQIPPPRKGA